MVYTSTQEVYSRVFTITTFLCKKLLNITNYQNYDAHWNVLNKKKCDEIMLVIGKYKGKISEGRPSDIVPNYDLGHNNNNKEDGLYKFRQEGKWLLQKLI